jgi:hypothetical protein
MRTKRGGLDMEGLQELVRERRSIRKFKPQDVPIQEIEELLEAASMHALVLFGLELSASIVLGDPLLNNRAIWLTSPTLEVSTVSTNPLNSH